MYALNPRFSIFSANSNVFSPAKAALVACSTYVCARVRFTISLAFATPFCSSILTVASLVSSDKLSKIPLPFTHAVAKSSNAL